MQTIQQPRGDRGFIMTIIVIIIAIIILKFVFKIDVIDALYYVKDVFITIWNDFLAQPVMYVWETLKSMLPQNR